MARVTLDKYSRLLSRLGNSRSRRSNQENSRSYREPTPRTPTYADDYRNLREILGTGSDISKGPRQADFRPSPYRGIDARDFVEYENLKNRYRDTYGKDYSEVGGSTSQLRGFADRFPVAESPIDRFRRERGENIRGIVPTVGRPVPPGFKQPGVSFGQALQGKATQQDKPAVTNDKSKAFGDLLKRMKRF
jgi:hypothetical protein